jgi:hypothetical protein
MDMDRRDITPSYPPILPFFEKEPVHYNKAVVRAAKIYNITPVGFAS